MDNYLKLNLIELRDETLAFEKHPFGTTLDKNQSSKFCQSGVKQTHFQNLKEKRKWFFLSQGHFNLSEECQLSRQVIFQVF